MTTKPKQPLVARFNQFNYVGALVGAVMTGAVGAGSLRVGFAVPLVLVVALFFLALIPQFIAPGAAHPGLAFLVLGLTFVATGTLWCLFVAVAAGAVHRRLAGTGRAAVWLKRLGGGLLVGLGARLAFSD